MEMPAIHTRVVSHLLNIDQHLVEHVVDGLRLKERPRPADTATSPLAHLRKSPPLSIILNGATSFQARKVGALVTDGVDIGILQALKTVLEEEGTLLALIAPHVGGVEASEGSWFPAAQKVNGESSVLYDAVALLPSADGRTGLLKEPTARFRRRRLCPFQVYRLYRSHPAAF
jgi:catalase